jgi:glutamate dehydrogenase
MSLVPEDSYFEKYLKLEFPKILSDTYFPEIKQHSLRREIIATQLSKTITDHMGVNFVERLQHETGAPVDFIIRSYAIVSELYDMTSLWHQIEALDPVVKVAAQQKMMLHIYYLIRRATRWFLRNRKSNINIQETIDHFKNPIAELIHALPTFLTDAEKETLENEINLLITEGVPSELAKSISICEILFTSLDIVEVATKHQFAVTDVAKVYYALDSLLELDWLRMQMNSYIIENQWDELARSRFRDDLEKAQSKLSVSVLNLKSKKIVDKPFEERINAWLKVSKHLIDRWQNLITEIKSSTNVDFVTYSVVLRELADFT